MKAQWLGAIGKEDRMDEKENRSTSPLQHGVKPYDRILLTKLEGEGFWRIILNPRWDYFTKAKNSLLQNECVEYAETKNGPSRDRMIRVSDIEKYGIKAVELEESLILRRDEAEA